MHNFIAYLEGTYNEYGLDETIRRLCLRTKLTLSKDKPKKIHFFDKRIILYDGDYCILINEKENGYTIEKLFNTYKIIETYDFQNEILERNCVFETSVEDERICLQSLQDTSLRIIKTDILDSQYDEGTFEFDRYELPDLGVVSTSKYITYEDHTITQEKYITTPTSLIYYRKEQDDKPVPQIEVSLLSNISPVVTAGRIRSNFENINESIRMPYPNILIDGTITENNEITGYYSVKILKVNDAFYVKLIEEDRECEEKEPIAFAMQGFKGPISSIEIDALILKCNEYFNKPYTKDLIYALEQVKDALLVKEGKKIGDLNQTELYLFRTHDFYELCYHVYENLPYYEQLINNLSKKQENNSFGLK